MPGEGIGRAARADHPVVAALPSQHAVKNDLSGFAARKEEASTPTRGSRGEPPGPGAAGRRFRHPGTACRGAGQAPSDRT
ncbi:hypothetical protein GCM10010269_78770 [Streptomyces humidus]|uniref:Uncharacterized protein n=1 Tax=Streptomyces humidus TaxID=52259 RepID=A0A918GCH5_9ACTN|nr:hypothetical protein GCM10010269_78770 [Streptomyces humidus]